MIAKETIKIPIELKDEYGYPADKDSFFTYSFKTKRINPSSFQNCREIFSYCFRLNTTGIGYTGCSVVLGRIVNFFRIIENRLGIQNKTVFYRTNHKRTIVARVSPWWCVNVFRRNMFTLMFRAATCHYRKGNVQASFKRYYLTKGSSVNFAINRFLKGYTELSHCRIKNGYEGINYIFSDLTRQEITDKLVTQ